MQTARDAARTIAQLLLSGPFDEPAVWERLRPLAGRRRWLRFCIRRMLTAWKGTGHPSSAWIIDFLLSDARFQASWPTLRTPEPRMSPAAGAPLQWPVPSLGTPDEVATWLAVSHRELEARADTWGREARTPAGPMRNFDYSWRGKRSGAARLIEAPRPRLRSLQRKVLHGVLDAIPPHDAAHGFRRGRSVATFTAPHVGKQIVVRMDLRDFFASIHRAQIQAIFATAGYPPAVAKLLAALCWNAAPDDIWLDFPGTLPDDLGRLPAARLYRRPHLPQGAPTSPAVANLCAYRLDCRLAGLARSAGAAYTRYADDLLFSGDADFARTARRFTLHVAAIAREEGFAAHPRKTRLMRQGVRQFAAGVVLNERPNVPRRDYERLKAILHRAARIGPSPSAGETLMTYRARLAGKIAWVASISPRRGEKLQAVFEQIDWGRPNVGHSLCE
ncbi:MAG: reverse transcriptase family protein [Planctomycetes bacterium]|nr:reverse transcriptase family protein [Planctomycetota bacterium]